MRDIRAHGDALTVTDDVNVTLHVMEYQNNVNVYLSDREVSEPEEVHLSLMAAVQDILRVDEVQNYKGLLLYRSWGALAFWVLVRCFATWLRRLDVLCRDVLGHFERLQAGETPRVVESAQW